MKKILVIALTLISSTAIAEQKINYKPETGDIIFHTSLSSQSLAIQHATDSLYSHVGIVFIQNGNNYVFEAVQPVKITSLKNWIKRGKKQHYVVKRIKNGLSEQQKTRLMQSGKQFIGKSYDLAFEWSDDKIYCSELVWKIYNNALGIELSKLKKLSAFNLNDPQVTPLLEKRYGNKIPLNEPVVAPSDLFDSPLLEKIAEQ